MQVNNFLPKAHLDYVKDEIKVLKNSYSREGYNNRKTIKDRLDPRFCGTQLITNPRNILYSIFSKYFWNELWLPLGEHGDYSFKHGLHTKTGKVLLSSYGNGDKYGAHVDVDVGSIFTAVLFISFNEIEGGDLLLEGTRVPFQNNKLVVFPSCMEHEVTKVETKSDDYLDNRFSIQYFVSAVPLNKPLIDESNNL